MKFPPLLRTVAFPLIFAGLVYCFIGCQICYGGVPTFSESNLQDDEDDSSSRRDQAPVIPSDISEFIKQADELLKAFDQDQDQALNNSEFKSITNPPKNADANGDGLVDKIELIKSLILSDGNSNRRTQSSPKAKKTGQLPIKPPIQTDRPKKNNQTKEVYDRYADGIFKNYDLNKDQKLDQDEMKSMRRPPQNADENLDGFVDRAELIAYVAQRVSQPKQRPRNLEGDKLESMLLKRIEERKRALADKQASSRQASVTKQNPSRASSVNDFNKIDDSVNHDRLYMLRVKRRNVLKRINDVLNSQYASGSASLSDIFESQSKLLEADLQLATNRSQRIQIHKNHVAEKSKLLDLSKRLANEGLIAGVKVLAAESELLDAEIRLAIEEGSQAGNQP